MVDQKRDIKREAEFIVGVASAPVLLPFHRWHFWPRVTEHRAGTCSGARCLHHPLPVSRNLRSAVFPDKDCLYPPSKVLD